MTTIKSPNEEHGEAEGFYLPKNLFSKKDKLMSLHFWDEQRCVQVITNNVPKAIAQMQKIYPGIEASVATGQPYEPQENQIQLKY